MSTEAPDGMRFVIAKGGSKIHLLPPGTNKALCGHEPKSRFSIRMVGRAGWWKARVDAIARPNWCEKCQQKRGV